MKKIILFLDGVIGNGVILKKKTSLMIIFLFNLVRSTLMIQFAYYCMEKLFIFSGMFRNYTDVETTAEKNILIFVLVNRNCNHSDTYQFFSYYSLSCGFPMRIRPRHQNATKYLYHQFKSIYMTEKNFYFSLIPVTFNFGFLYFPILIGDFSFSCYIFV